MVELGRHAILRGWCLTGRGGSNPPFGIFLPEQKNDTEDTQALQSQTVVGSSIFPSEQNQNTRKHQNDTNLHEKCVICVSEFPDDLKLVMESWGDLPDAVRVGIVAMVEAARKK